MKKMILLIMCVVIVVSAVSGLFTSAQAAADYTYIRVKLSIGSPSNFSFLVDGNYSVSGQALERQLYTVRIEGAQLTLYLGSTAVTSGSTIYVTRHQGTAGRNNTLWLNNKEYGNLSYLGDMSFSIQNGAIQLVNRIHLEEYLYGVVAYEMSDSFPLEALKSQAVAARNYAASEISSSGTYDLTDLGSSDQVYKGYDPSLTNVIAAVDGTRGQVIKYGGSIIAAYYSASNGGATDVPLHRWGGGANWVYYDIQPDPYDLANPSSLYETIYFPVSIDQAHPVTSYGNDGTPNTSVAVNYIKTAILNSGQLSGYGIGNINQFELSGVTNLYAHTFESPGTIAGSTSQDHSRMPFSGVNNCIDLVRATGEFTVTINTATLSATLAGSGESVETDVEKSSTITENEDPMVNKGPTVSDELAVGEEPAVSGEPAIGEEPAISGEPAVSEEPITASAEKSAEPADAGGTAIQVTGVDFYMRSLNGSDGDNTWKAFQSTRLGILAVDAVYDNGVLSGFSISQRRYGHGVGLSQRGAQQRAKSTDPAVNTYDKILAFYYPNATLDSLGITAPSLPAALPETGYTNAKVVNATTLNVRSGPSTSYSAIGVLPGGARVEVMESQVASTWYMINYGGTVAYISQSYVQQDSNTIVSKSFIRRRGQMYISLGTTCSTLAGSLTGDSGTITIRNAAGSVITGNTKVGAGATVTLSSGNSILDKVTVYLKGDVNGDAQINVSDYTSIRTHILKMTTLDSFGAQMADINDDGKIDIADYTFVRLYLLGLLNNL